MVARYSSTPTPGPGPGPTPTPTPFARFSCSTCIRFELREERTGRLAFLSWPLSSSRWMPQRTRARFSAKGPRVSSTVGRTCSHWAL
jgi:hypothetical protein